MKTCNPSMSILRCDLPAKPTQSPLKRPQAIKRGSYQVITTSLLRVRTYELEDGERVSTGEWLEVT